MNIVPNVGQWRVAVEVHHNFARDELSVFVGGRTQSGFHMLKPTVLEFELCPEGVSRTDTGPSLSIPNELAQAMLEALVPHFLGTDVTNVLGLVRRLTQERDKAVAQLDALIDGIGRLSKPTP